MKANELMIGDWVLDTEFERNEPDRIGIVEDEGRVWLKDRNCYQSVTYCEPIPLTPEILEKNGFGYTECDERTKHFYLGDSCYCANTELHIGTNVEKNNGVYWLNYKYNSVWRILYVHQLQHVFRLFEIDKDIEL